MALEREQCQGVEKAKDATEPCNANQICSNLTPLVDGQGHHTCTDANQVLLVKKACIANEGTNCGGETVNCSITTTCRAELQGAVWKCVNGAAYGTMSTFIAKITQECAP